MQPPCVSKASSCTGWLFTGIQRAEPQEASIKAVRRSSLDERCCLRSSYALQNWKQAVPQNPLTCELDHSLPYVLRPETVREFRGRRSMDAMLPTGSSGRGIGSTRLRLAGDYKHRKVLLKRTFHVACGAQISRRERYTHVPSWEDDST